jgi:hypothetical protein
MGTTISSPDRLHPGNRARRKAVSSLRAALRDAVICAEETQPVAPLPLSLLYLSASTLSLSAPIALLLVIRFLFSLLSFHPGLYRYVPYGDHVRQTSPT